MKPKVLMDYGYGGEGWEEDRDRLARHVELVEPEGKEPYSEAGLIAAISRTRPWSSSAFSAASPCSTN